MCEPLARISQATFVFRQRAFIFSLGDTKLKGIRHVNEFSKTRCRI